ncbi:MAG TPA: hypothetical protein VF821_02170, partial [Lentzea sp.]
ALYERRHLLQLVAVKRLQSEGRALSEIQAELAGATDATLAAIAKVPGELLEGADATPLEVVRPRFWAEPVAAPAKTRLPEAAALNGVALGGGAVVLVPGTPTATDLADIAAAAQPLLDLLAARGLLNEREQS